MVEESKSFSNGSDSSTSRPSRLLLVDDDPALLDALSSTIEFHLGPLRLDACDTGAKALDLAKANSYDAMIVDVNMPNMNGLELLSAVKRLQPHTPVLLISAYASEAIKERAWETGASDFIPKPFDRATFLSAVRHGLQLSQRMD
jgi:CheY-like chemotaxis protein